MHLKIYIQDIQVRNNQHSTKFSTPYFLKLFNNTGQLLESQPMIKDFFRLYEITFSLHSTVLNSVNKLL